MPRIAAGNLEINYETYGEGEPLLLIMGFGLPGVAWLPMLPFFSGFRCIYFDNRGTGNSDKLETSYTIADMADDASYLMNALAISQAKVYGISMGGMIAQELVLRHPEQVEKVVLGCTMAGGSTAVRASDEVYGQLSEAFATLAANPQMALDQIMPLLFPQEFIAQYPELGSMLLAGFKMAPPTPPASIERTRAAILEFDAYERLPQVKCPVMIVHGEKDILVPPENVAIIRAAFRTRNSFSSRTPATVMRRQTPQQFISAL